MKKIIIGIFMVLMVFGLAACGNDNDGLKEGARDSNPSVVTELEVNELIGPQDIVRLDFDEDEMVENPYYKRTANADGESVYMVKRASDDEYVYLPVTETVIYSGTEGNCSYQEINLTYKVDGVETEKKQYQIYVSSAADDYDTIQVVPGNEDDEGANETKLAVM